MNKLKIGLEVHVQLSTGKLFCRCQVESDGREGNQIRRRLKPTSGESGEIDRAALYEEERSRSFLYTCPSNTCLVEYDEEPPHELDANALKTAVEIAGSMHCKIIGKIECMRKIVIDGSNTSGFQRTMLIASDGYVETSKGRVGIISVCLEEDSARKTESNGDEVSYSLGRLGIPLVEIATSPDIVDPEHAAETARIIGMHAILTGNTRHDSDSIRQDVNMSMGHGRVEIKGVSKLSVIKDALEAEVERQEMLEKIALEINKRGGVPPDSLKFEDVTDLVSKSGSKVVMASLASGNRAFGTLLKNLSGVLKKEDLRFGAELGDVAKAFSVGGIMHSDELPGYGIDQKTKDSLAKRFHPDRNDAFMMILAPEAKVSILEYEMSRRISRLINLDLSETRFFNEKGRTAYLRPLPGSERMYPETDIQPMEISEKEIKRATALGQLSIDGRISGISEEYGISKQDANTLVTSLRLRLFTDLATQLNPRFAVRMLLQRVPELERKSGKSIEPGRLRDLVFGVKKQDLPDISVDYALELLFSGIPVNEIVGSNRLVPLSSQELNNFVAELIKKNKDINAGQIMSTARRELNRPFDPKEMAGILNMLGTRKEQIR